MSEGGLAPSNVSPGQYQPQTQDPFSNPSSVPIRRPDPCAHIPSNSRSARVLPARDGAADDCTDIRDEKTSRHDYESGMHGTQYSDSSGSIRTPFSSIDLEKSSMARAKSNKSSIRDPEKAIRHTRNDSHQQGDVADAESINYSEEDDGEQTRRRQEQNAIKILLFLSGPCVLLSALNTAWACISLVITFLSQPVRTCATRPTFGQQLAGLLGPALNLQLRCIYTPLPPHANEDASYHAPMLVVVQLLSPFLSLGMMVVAWVVAAYWMCSMVLGDPAGMDNLDDGRETVLGLRGWWEAWLMRSVMEQ